MSTLRSIVTKPSFPEALPDCASRRPHDKFIRPKKPANSRRRSQLSRLTFGIILLHPIARQHMSVARCVPTIAWPAYESLSGCNGHSHRQQCAVWGRVASSPASPHNISGGISCRTLPANAYGQAHLSAQSRHGARAGNQKWDAPETSQLVASFFRGPRKSSFPPSRKTIGDLRLKCELERTTCGPPKLAMGPPCPFHGTTHGTSAGYPPVTYPSSPAACGLTYAQGA